MQGLTVNRCGVLHSTSAVPRRFPCWIWRMLSMLWWVLKRLTSCFRVGIRAIQDVDFPIAPLPLNVWDGEQR